MSVLGLPRSALIVLSSLVKNGPMCPKDLCADIGLAPRTVSFALRKLMRSNLLRRIPNLGDMRKSLYVADETRIKELFIRFGVDSITALQPVIAEMIGSTRAFTR